MSVSDFLKRNHTFWILIKDRNKYSLPPVFSFYWNAIIWEIFMHSVRSSYWNSIVWETFVHSPSSSFWHSIMWEIFVYSVCSFFKILFRERFSSIFAIPPTYYYIQKLQLVFLQPWFFIQISIIVPNESLKSVWIWHRYCQVWSYDPTNILSGHGFRYFRSGF